MSKLILCLSIVLILGFASLPIQAASPDTQAVKADSPKMVIATFYDGLQHVMKNGADLKFKGREEALAPLLSKTFDFDAMTKLCLSYTYNRLTPEQRVQITNVFRDYTIATYAANFDSYHGEKFTVLGSKSLGSGSEMVETTLTPAGSAPIQLNYVMENSGSGWRVTDILAEGGISQIAQRRSEFVSVIRKDGFEALIALIQKKTLMLSEAK